MLRVSNLTDYATVIMACLAAAPGEVLSAQAVAERTRLEAPTTSKLLKQLGQAGLVVSTRGARGGYELAREASRISIADIVVAVDGPIALTACSARPGACDREPWCGVGLSWRRINSAINDALAGVSLADMLRPVEDVVIPLRLALP